MELIFSGGIGIVWLVILNLCLDASFIEMSIYNYLH